MTALSVVTVAFKEGCVDEHMEQDGEVCIHRPLQRRLIVSIALCLLIVAHCSERRERVYACEAQGLNSFEPERCRLASWTKSRTQRPLCSVLRMARISPVVPRTVFRSHVDFFQNDEQVHCSICQQCRQKSKRVFHNTPHNIRVTRASHAACIPQRFTKHPRNTFPATRELSTTFHKTPT